MGLAVVPRVHRRARRPAVRRRRRRAGAARRAAPARHGRAGRRPRARHAGRHRGDGPARGGRRRGGRARLHDVADAQPPHEHGRVHADAHRRARRAGRHRAGDRRTGTGVLQVVSDFADVDAEFAIFRRMAEASRPSAVVLAAAGASQRRLAYRRMLDAISEANADGPRGPAQVAARRVGLLLGLQCTLHPLARCAVVPRDRRPAAPRARRGAVRSRGQGRGARRVTSSTRCARVSRFDQMFELGDPPDYEPDPRRA